MTKDDIASAVTPLIRHGLTVAAGFLAARGFAGATDLVSSFTSAGVVLVATVAWSLLEKNKLVSAAIGELPVSTLEQVAQQVIDLRKNGADPLLVAHIAQAVTAVANNELATARPELVPAVPQPDPIATTPAAPVPVAPETSAPPAPVTPQASPSGGVEPLPVEQAPQPVLADGSMPS